jgi:hypothetical protein
MGTLRTYNTRAWRRQGHSSMAMATYEKDGREVRELLIIQNGWALRHTPKQGMPEWVAADESETAGG